MRIAALSASVVAMAPRVAGAAPMACESMGQVKLSNGLVLSAESVPAGAFTPPNANNAAAAAGFKSLPAFCRVTLKLTPSADSDIRVEVWLPLSGWNHKIQAAGNGGVGGTMPYLALATAVKAGYGVKDGVLEAPSRCSFDFATLRCTGGDRPDCLTTDQVETAEAMTSPIRDPKSGALLHPGRYYPGSELGWGGVAGPSPSGES